VVGNRQIITFGSSVVRFHSYEGTIVMLVVMWWCVMSTNHRGTWDMCLSKGGSRNSLPFSSSRLSFPPLRSRPHKPTTRSGERCKLSQWG